VLPVLAKAAFPVTSITFWPTLRELFVASRIGTAGVSVWLPASE